MKRTISSVIGLAGFALLFALGTAQNAQAKKACSNATLSGDYAVVITGSITGLPFGAVDLATADGNGNISGSGTTAFAGTISVATFTATYTVNSDCSGSATFSSGRTQNFVVNQDGSEVRLIETDNPNAVVTGQGKRID